MCPSRILADSPEIDTVLAWWVQSTTWDAMGGPAGDPDWPLPGGRLRQPAKLVAAVDLLRAGYRYVRTTKDPEDKGKAARKARRK